MAALSAAFMIGSLFPYLTYGIPALASLFIMVAVVEVGVLWGFASYIVSALLVILLPGDPEAKLMYIAILGYHPVLKAVLETRCKRVIESPLKYIIFNISLVVAYSLIARFVGVELGNMNEFGKYTVLIMILLANAVFTVYDIMITRMSIWYSVRLHKAVMRIFNK